MTNQNQNLDVSTGLFENENNQAETLISQGDLPAAAHILVKVLENDPVNFRAYNNVGIISWTRKAWEDAYSMFKKSLTIKPDYTDALINIFDAALKLRRINDVLAIFQKALEFDPDLEEAKIIYESIQSQGDAIYLSERGLIVGVYNPRIDEAQQLITDGKFLPAMELLLKINDEEGPSAEAFSGLGVISYYQKRYTDAFALFVESIKLNPTSTDAFLNLLDAAKGCNKIGEATQIYNLFIKRFPFLSSVAADFEEAAKQSS